MPAGIEPAGGWLLGQAFNVLLCMAASISIALKSLLAIPYDFMGLRPGFPDASIVEAIQPVIEHIDVCPYACAVYWFLDFVFHCFL